MDNFIYKENKTRMISFPLGGIGSGVIGLAGNGQLIDFEIFNKPNKLSDGKMSHFTVKVERESEVVDVRVLNSDHQPPYTGSGSNFGFGLERSSLMGMPHFERSEFIGEFPLAKINFFDENFPGKVSLTAFNPFIPTNEDDSSLPLAFFEYEIENNTDNTLTYSIALSQATMYGTYGKHSDFTENGINGIFLDNALQKDDLNYGNVAIATDAATTDSQLYWYRGSWFDSLATFWHDFSEPGQINKRVYDDGGGMNFLEFNPNDVAVLIAKTTINPRESKKIRFVLAWYAPYVKNYWNEPKPREGDCCSGSCDCDRGTDKKELENRWGNYYAMQFKDSQEVSIYGLKNYDRFLAETSTFKDALFASTMPKELLEAVSANLATIKSPTVLRLTDGSLYGFEGCHCDAGCCEGSCTHVWSYTYAIPFLFPKLERSMRSLEYNYSMHENGGMGFRLQLPLGRTVDSFRPCADGQFATVMRVYREFKISGDVTWLKSIWDKVKLSLEFAWSEKNEDKWDANKDGLLEGRQHHTLDMELFGENSWLSGLYLGALKAACYLAEVLEDETAKDTYSEIYESGVKKLNAELFNGEYFYHKIDLNDHGILEKYAHGSNAMGGNNIYKTYWHEEAKEIKYQIADGSSIDQVLAQWHANLMGLGDIFEKGKVKSALKSIYKYNFIKDMRAHVNPCRLYCLNDEQGLIIASWPKGVHKPLIAAPYSEETMNGFEYQAAIHMIQEGMIDEGVECIKAIRARFDGERRNPWNEFECGNNYARSMASYALIPTYAGFKYNCFEKYIGFAPIWDKKYFHAFWSLDSGFGTVEYTEDAVVLRVLYGEVELSKLGIENIDISPKTVLLNNTQLDFILSEKSLIFDAPIKISKGDVLSVR